MLLPQSIVQIARFLILLSALFLIAACDKGKPLRISGYPLLKPSVPTNHFVAGTGQQEITPYAGIPLGGHGIGGRIARGTWMPLYARAFYFEDTSGRAVAMVSCDLFAVSEGLRAEVLRLVNKQARLEPSALLLSATHTHHGPANFASSAAYNGFGGPLPNFDKNVFDFLAPLIADAIVRAISDAHSHESEEQELILYSGFALGIQRNRAVTPFLRNDASLIQQIHDESYSAGTRCPDGSTENCPRYFATDPTLRVLEIRRNGMRRGLLVFYAVHPTAMSHDSEFYSPDLTGYAMKELGSSDGVVAGFFNGAEGDVSPDWDRQDREDVLRLGGALAMAVRNVISTTPVERSKQIDVKTYWTHAKQNGAEWTAAKFAAKPVPGAGEVGGAEDGPTVFYNYGFRGEARKLPEHATPEQGVKQPALSQPLKEFLDGWELGSIKLVLGIFGVWNLPDADSFPAEFPAGRLELGSVARFAFIPVEATTAVGSSIHAALGPETIILGLTNEYFGYTVTRDEYALQQYESGSTELGPNEAEGVVTLLKLAKAEPAQGSIGAQKFMPGKWRSSPLGLDLTLLRVPRNMVTDDLSPLLPTRLKRLESRIPRFRWIENDSGNRQPSQRRVSLYSKDANQPSYTLFANDRKSPDFLTAYDGGSTSMRTYISLWIPPLNGGTTSYYFSVQTGDGRTLCSEPFTVASLKPNSPVPQEEQCPRMP
jgi:neutral ceramidase